MPLALGGLFPPDHRCKTSYRNSGVLWKLETLILCCVTNDQQRDRWTLREWVSECPALYCISEKNILRLKHFKYFLTTHNNWVYSNFVETPYWANTVRESLTPSPQLPCTQHRGGCPSACLVMVLYCTLFNQSHFGCPPAQENTNTGEENKTGKKRKVRP